LSSPGIAVRRTAFFKTPSPGDLAQERCALTSGMAGTSPVMTG
jgi:hypothetical protein